jgi:hypothetical protein
LGVAVTPAADIATVVRQAIELPEVSPGAPAGKYLHAVMQLVLSWYCAFIPVQLLVIAVQ